MSRNRQQPIVTKTSITERYVVITRYRATKVGFVEALEKFDVHDQVTALIEEEIRRRARERAKRTAARRARSKPEPPDARRD